MIGLAIKPNNAILWQPWAQHYKKDSAPGDVLPVNGGSSDRQRQRNAPLCGDG